MKQRKSNLELMRLLMICTVPIFHLMLYNNVFSGGWSPTTITALVLCAGGGNSGRLCIYQPELLFLLQKEECETESMRLEK